MVLKHIIFYVFLNFYLSNAAVFFCSNKKLEISALQAFTGETFLNLISQLDNPEVIIFKSVTVLSPDIKEIIITRGYYSTYIPNGEYDEINVEDVTDLIGEYEADSVKIKDTLSGLNNTENILVAIFLPSKRFKREAKDIAGPVSSPVIYHAKNKNNLYALLYSSQPLLLRLNDTKPIELHLGNAKPDMIIYDNRLNVHVLPLEGKDKGKVILRFSFSWLGGYWSLSSVKVSYANASSGEFNLTTDEDITAPAYFSYHCNGETIFSDPNGVELHIYDLQVQTDSRNGKFGDANDCVPFTTTPIWSGLFVTALLGIGLIIALTAIMDIKTMDKFDNHETKNLTITISE